MVLGTPAGTGETRQVGVPAIKILWPRRSQEDIKQVFIEIIRVRKGIFRATRVQSEAPGPLGAERTSEGRVVPLGPAGEGRSLQAGGAAKVVKQAGTAG